MSTKFLRRFAAAVALAGVAAGSPSAWPQSTLTPSLVDDASSGHAAPGDRSLERCLLDAIEHAEDGASVGSIRRHCEASHRAETGTTPAPAPWSPVQRRIEQESELARSRFVLLPHRPNYIDPFSHAFEPPESVASDAHVQRNEVKFQISFKFALTPPLFDERAAVFFAYTGGSWWQAYNHNRSSPFREYSHEPELFVAWKPNQRFLGWDWRVASAGLVHQSNGRSGASSRSWNRLFADLRFDRPGGWWLGVRPWWRIPESRKPFAGSPEGDDNPGIERFVGDGELRAGYVGDIHQFTLTMRRSFASSGKGAVQLDYSRPTGFSPHLRWHIQYFDGYGESLLEYQTRMRRIGFGVMLNDWY